VSFVVFPVLTARAGEGKQKFILFSPAEDTKPQLMAQQTVQAIGLAKQKKLRREGARPEA
jgi:hypothetical protein